ncbi:MAG: hypothetical protein EP335_01590 [Alphaproteobacteria bacterium]|nr:MAG: hypothetical protein EP335_01590 [Alphaproteobacteria bacterium]
MFGARKHNFALVCGLVRDELECLLTLGHLQEERASGLFDGIVLSTWHNEVDNIPGLRQQLERDGVILVESTAPDTDVRGHAWAQHKATLAGLRAIPDGAAVWRGRTDRSAHLLKSFRSIIAAGPEATCRYGAIKPVFRRRVAAMAVLASVPFYATDFAYYGLKEDLMKMVHFDGRYDSLFHGFGAEQRLWTHPFLTAFPELGAFYENIHILGLSTHVIDAVRSEKPLPDALVRLFAFYWVCLHNNIRIVDSRDYDGDIGLHAALGAGNTSGVRCGTGASKPNFTTTLATFNCQEALDQLVTGTLPDTADNRQLQAALKALKRKGVAALPAWSDGLAAELAALRGDNDIPLVTPPVYRTGDGTPFAGGANGHGLRDMLERASGVSDIQADDLALVEDAFKSLRQGADSGTIYGRIGDAILAAGPDDAARRRLAGFFLLRAAERGNHDAAARFGWLVHAGALDKGNRQHAAHWAGIAAYKNVPLAQHVLSLMYRDGWIDDPLGEQADHWQGRARENGFSEAMLETLFSHP